MDIQAFETATEAFQKLLELDVVKGTQLALEEVAIRGLGVEVAMFCRAERMQGKQQLYVLAAAGMNKEEELGEIQLEDFIAQSVVMMVPTITQQRLGSQQNHELTDEENVVLLLPSKGAKFSMDDAQRAADLIAKWVSFARKVNSYRRQAQVDDVTGLANHRMFTRWTEALAGSLIHGENQATTLIIFDIDNFKRYNDEKGYDEGNAELQRVAGRLKQLPDKLWKKGRRHGDEFFAITGGDSDTTEGAIQSIVEEQAEGGAPISAGMVTILPGKVDDLFSWLQEQGVECMGEFELSRLQHDVAHGRNDSTTIRSVSTVMKAAADHLLLQYSKKKEGKNAVTHVVIGK